MNLAHTIEAILFYKGEPEDVAALAKILETDREQVEAALGELDETLRERGIRLLRVGDSVALGSAPEADEVIERMRRNDLVRDIGKAGLETLAIVLYQGTVTRAQIEYIRGVQSSYILRHLLMRGLVERVATGKKSVAYRPTLELLAHLGLTRVEDLPDYHGVQQTLKMWAESEATERELAAQ